MRAIVELVVLVVLASGAPWALAAPKSDDYVLVGKVTNVVDGDTIDVKLDSGPIRVRFASIDAPEHDQPYGSDAAALLRKLVDGREVRLSVETQDRYDRLVAKVFVGGNDVNAELVRQGAAWAYRDYLTDPSLLKVEAEARCARRGLWAAGAVPPWEWRRGERRALEWHCEGNAPNPSEPPKPSFQCGTKHYCREMTTCEEAKFFLTQCHVTTLDGDHDGVPCEALCR